MEVLIQINNAINRVVWGIPMLALLVGGGIIFTMLTRGVQFRKFVYAIQNTLFKVFTRVEAGKGEMTPFQAMSTALAGTVGTGNIAGVTTAIILGGPGSLFWLWITALVGMCTKYAEVLLAVKYRRRNDQGDWVGGPMYYIRNGLGKNWTWLAGLFAIFTMLASFGTGNGVQVGNIVSSINTAIEAFNPAFTGQKTVGFVLGIVLAVLVAVIIFGGVKRIGSVTEKLVPFMALVYIAVCLIVVIRYIGSVPAVFRDIFAGAFSPKGLTGGAVGSFFVALTWGVKRGVFSNEAGLGSAPIAHASTSETDPVKQGLYGIFEVFVGSMIICTLSGLSVLCAFEASPDLTLDYGNSAMATTAMNSQALGTVFTNQGGSLIIAVGIVLFAFSTVLGWALYGARACEFVFGTKVLKLYQALFVIVVFVGAVMDLSLVWDIADTLNGLMAIPNLIGVLALSPIVVKETKRHFDGQKFVPGSDWKE